MKNPQFGLWVKDDEESVPATEAVDKTATRALSLVEELQTRAALDLYADEANELPRQRVSMACRAAELSAAFVDYVYERPLKQEEAETLLKSAGIRFHRVVHTYVADRASLVDRDTGAAPWPRAQCVVAEVPAELTFCGGKKTQSSAIVRLFFVFTNKRWRLVKAAVERSV